MNEILKRGWQSKFVKCIQQTNVRHKTKTEHWAKLRRKKWPTDRALGYFDDFYRPVFGDKWPSIRLGLLCPRKYCAVLNNFSKLDQNVQLMNEIGALDVKTKYDAELKKWEKRRQIEIQNLERFTAKQQQATLSDSDIEVGEDELKENNETFDRGALSELDNSGVVFDRGAGGLHQFMPATKMKGLESWLDETDYVGHYDPNVEVPFPIEKEKTVPFPEYLHVRVFGRDDISTFPRPRPDDLDLLGYYLMDAASLLPVLMLQVGPGESVLDMCAAPGGKSLAIIQTMRAESLVCNDVSLKRYSQLKTAIGLYVPAIPKLQDRIKYSKLDAENWGETNAYDKVLVDVPCTNDRMSATKDSNNIFTQNRLRERIALPQHQINMLYSALQAVKPGGSVVYSTCSLSPIQNDGVVHMALRKSWEASQLQFTISDLTDAIAPFQFLFRFHDKLRYGQLVLPFLPLNYGPMYFCKINRKA